jgi:hypothetical protein
MMTLTIPDTMEQQLKTIAQAKQMTLSQFALALLQKALQQQLDESKSVSCFDLMKEGFGCIDDAPSDLSVNKDYFAGYGQ